MRLAALGLATAALTLAVAAPATAATAITCPSTTCVNIATNTSHALHGVGSDGQGNAYATTWDGNLIKVNTKAVVASGLGNLRGIAADATGVYVAEFNGTVLKVDPATGARQVIASGLNVSLQGVARHQELTYVVGGNSLYEIGTATRVVSNSIGMGMDVAIHGTTAYVADLGGKIKQVDLVTGSTKDLLKGAYDPTHVGVLGDGTVYFIEAGFLLHHVDPRTQQDTVLGELRGVNAIDFSLEPNGKALVSDWSGNGKVWQLTV
ncbi:hypothetical protein LWC34_47470 [Kibdelosporangium philippinense]|uniref:ATP/GTP-binding protein n=1 Tax=Kibdelosporangium philippinense TaxID=211113 RepID=A0ABS8ZRN8_9PSEU|nr:hypothetical protein [Kibdelosporangium philippinense]MCE7010396.1 hypothetical protein [Kibdelosporangium philippinense]